MIPSAVLDLKDLSLLLPGKPHDTVLLGDITLSIPKGQFVAIVGPSGCGKSTLLKLIAGLSEASEGNIFWNMRNLETRDFEPHEVGYVPQFSIAYELLTVEENLDTTIRLRIRGMGATERSERVASILAQVGLTEIADRQVRVLSGGQRRRLALALELATSPALLLCDEVTSGLDPKAEDEMVSLLGCLSQEHERTVLSVTHSLRHLDGYDTVIVLYQGRLAFHGPPSLLTHYFQIEAPEDLYPQLSTRKPDAWHRSWTKHREPYIEAIAAAKKPTHRKPEPTPPPKPDDEDEVAPIIRKKGRNQRRKGKPPLAKEEKPEDFTPGLLSQFLTLLGRRWKLFFRDPSAIWLQLALIAGFPCLVVLFALDGLPQIANLSLHLSDNPLETMKESIDFVASSGKAGSLVSGLVMFQVILLTLVASNNGAREIAGERLLFEKEKFGGLRPLAYVASKWAFLLTLITAQSLWMGLFVKVICDFPGDPAPQLAVLILVNAAMTAICLGISSFARTAEQASLISIYFVGFQLPLSGAVLSLPDALGWITRPFIAAYWGWSGYLQTLRDTRFYETVQAISQTSLSPGVLCHWVLLSHVFAGLLVTLAGCRNSRWPH